jgi:hypothetical protein
MLSENVLPATTDDPAFDSRFGPGLRLFWAMVERLQRGCVAAGTRCAIALMGGRSLVETPSSLSAQFQDYFRRRIASGAAERRVDVIDIGGELRKRYDRQAGRWFHPNEGHLNTDGQRVVAEVFEEALSPLLDSRSR